MRMKNKTLAQTEKKQSHTFNLHNLEQKNYMTKKRKEIKYKFAIYIRKLVILVLGYYRKLRGSKITNSYQVYDYKRAQGEGKKEGRRH